MKTRKLLSLSDNITAAYILAVLIPLFTRGIMAFRSIIFRPGCGMADEGFFRFVSADALICNICFCWGVYMLSDTFSEAGHDRNAAVRKVVSPFRDNAGHLPKFCIFFIVLWLFDKTGIPDALMMRAYGSGSAALYAICVAAVLIFDICGAVMTGMFFAGIFNLAVNCLESALAAAMCRLGARDCAGRGKIRRVFSILMKLLWLILMEASSVHPSEKCTFGIIMTAPEFATCFAMWLFCIAEQILISLQAKCGAEPLSLFRPVSALFSAVCSFCAGDKEEVRE